MKIDRGLLDAAMTSLESFDTGDVYPEGSVLTALTLTVTAPDGRRFESSLSRPLKVEITE